MNNLTAEVLPDDLNPAVVAAIAVFIGEITGLIPPPANAFPREWHDHLRSLTKRLDEIRSINGDCGSSTAFVVMAATTYEGADPVRAFASKEAAQVFAQRCLDYDANGVECPTCEAPDEEWERWEKANETWEMAHPAAPFFRRAGYHTLEIGFSIQHGGGSDAS